MHLAILDKNHEVLPVEDLLYWGAWFDENTELRNVDKTQINDDILVSTVFMGINSGHGDGPALWFESMVFGGKMDQEQRRYSTWTQAVAGHDQLVAEVREAL